MMIYQILFTIIILCVALSTLLGIGFMGVSTDTKITYIKIQQVCLGIVCTACLGVLLTFVWRV